VHVIADDSTCVVPSARGVSSFENGPLILPGSSVQEIMLQATSIGGIARKAITLACAQADAPIVQAQVHSAFDNAWNLWLPPRTLVSVVRHEIGHGPLSVVLRPGDGGFLSSRRPHRGAPVRIHAQGLSVQTNAEHWLHIDISAAQTWWTPKHVANAVSPACVAENLEYTAAWMAGQEKVGGLCSLARGEDRVFRINPLSRAGECAGGSSACIGCQRGQCSGSAPSDCCWPGTRTHTLWG